MKRLILLILPAIYLLACHNPEPPPPPPKHVHHAKSDNPEDFQAVEKPPSYGQ